MPLFWPIQAAWGGHISGADDVRLTFGMFNAPGSQIQREYLIAYAQKSGFVVQGFVGLDNFRSASGLLPTTLVVATVPKGNICFAALADQIPGYLF